MNLRKGGGQHEINILNLCLDSATFQHIAKFGKKKKKYPLPHIKSSNSSSHLCIFVCMHIYLCVYLTPQ